LESTLMHLSSSIESKNTFLATQISRVETFRLVHLSVETLVEFEFGVDKGRICYRLLQYSILVVNTDLARYCHLEDRTGDPRDGRCYVISVRHLSADRQRTEFRD